MTSRKDIASPATGGAIDSFLDQARKVTPAPGPMPKARLVFALDATMSRQPTWDLACRLQGEMFATASGVGGSAASMEGRDPVSTASARSPEDSVVVRLRG